MPYSDAARRYASDEIQRRRQNAMLQSDKQRNAILSENPLLKELEEKMKAYGILMMKCAVAHDTEQADALSEEISKLKQKQKEILKQNHVSESALDVKFYCTSCNDTGISPDGSVCHCVVSLLKSYTLSEICKSSPLALCSFDAFQLDYYKNTIDPACGISPRENMRHNLEICREFAKSFPNKGKSLMLLGNAGLGKTHLALSIASEVLRKNFEVLYCSAPSILKQIESEHFDKNHDTSTLDSLKRCDLLVLDDLGAEFNGPFIVSTLYDLINTRIIERRSTIITTNITEEDTLTRRYGEKISSRLIGCCSVLPFIGDDIRILRNNG